VGGRRLIDDLRVPAVDHINVVIDVSTLGEIPSHSVGKDHRAHVVYVQLCDQPLLFPAIFESRHLEDWPFVVRSHSPPSVAADHSGEPRVQTGPRCRPIGDENSPIRHIEVQKAKVAILLRFCKGDAAEKRTVCLPPACEIRGIFLLPPGCINFSDRRCEATERFRNFIVKSPIECRKA
jgi:hypothetical protein